MLMPVNVIASNYCLQRERMMHYCFATLFVPDPLLNKQQMLDLVIIRKLLEVNNLDVYFGFTLDFILDYCALGHLDLHSRIFYLDLYSRIFLLDLFSRFVIKVFLEYGCCGKFFWSTSSSSRWKWRQKTPS